MEWRSLMHSPVAYRAVGAIAALALAAVLAACTPGATPSPSGMMEESASPSGMMEESASPSGMMEESASPSGMMEESASPSAP
jgi:hypothetical protein